jgi:hypothetical protein
MVCLCQDHVTIRSTTRTLEELVVSVKDTPKTVSTTSSPCRPSTRRPALEKLTWRCAYIGGVAGLGFSALDAVNVDTCSQWRSSVVARPGRGPPSSAQNTKEPAKNWPRKEKNCTILWAGPPNYLAEAPPVGPRVFSMWERDDKWDMSSGLI